MILYSITAPHFVAGAVWIKQDGTWRCDPRQCAPILHWMCGKSAASVQQYLEFKGWQVERIKPAR